MLKNLSFSILASSMATSSSERISNQDECFRLNVEKLITLALIPVDEVVNGFDLIPDQFEDDARRITRLFRRYKDW